MTTKDGLAPVVDENSRVLILGTLPGDESLRQQRYYADPSNQFWSLLAGVFDTPVEGTYAERLEFLATRGVALWDVLRSAERAGSTDSVITKPRPNEFGDLFAKFPALRRVAFNGTKAEGLWRRHIRTGIDVPQGSLITTTLPSSSGTPGRHVLPFDEKLVRWRVLAPHDGAVPSLSRQGVRANLGSGGAGSRSPLETTQERLRRCALEGGSGLAMNHPPPWRALPARAHERSNSKAKPIEVVMARAAGRTSIGRWAVLGSNQ
jgi:double-stranded uracil-DNA glycosylase